MIINTVASFTFSALCILNSGTADTLQQNIFAPQMNAQEYRIYKERFAGGKYAETADDEFLLVITDYCPEQFAGVDEIELDDNHQLLTSLLRKSERDTQIDAHDNALEELNSRPDTAVVDATEPQRPGYARYMYQRGWRKDINGDWRDQDGNYAPWNPNYDQMSDYGYASVTTGDMVQVVKDSYKILPRVLPTAQPDNEFLSNPKESEGWLNGWYMFVVTCLGTIVLIMIIGGILFGISQLIVRAKAAKVDKMTVYPQETKDETEGKN